MIVHKRGSQNLSFVYYIKILNWLCGTMLELYNTKPASTSTSLVGGLIWFGPVYFTITVFRPSTIPRQCACYRTWDRYRRGCRGCFRNHRDRSSRCAHRPASARTSKSCSSGRTCRNARSCLHGEHMWLQREQTGRHVRSLRRPTTEPPAPGHHRHSLHW